MRLPSWTAKAAILAIWLPIVATLGWKFEKYEATPGALGAFETAWPKGSALSPDPSRPTILVFVHPQCPCTRASLTEIDRVVGFHPKGAKLYAVIRGLDSNSQGWTDTETVRQARKVPDMTVYVDHGGIECKRFNAQTSGTVLVFSPGGRKEMFRGGVTPERGHEGDCLGVDSIDHYLETGQMSVRSTSVFGCSLF